MKTQHFNHCIIEKNMFRIKNLCFTYLILSTTFICGMKLTTSQNEKIHAETLKKEQQCIPKNIRALHKVINKYDDNNTPIVKLIQDINDQLPYTSTTTEILRGLSITCNRFNELVDSYIAEHITNEEIFTKLSNQLQNHILSQGIKSTCNPILLPYTTSLQKTSVKFVSSLLVATLHFQTEYGWATSLDYQRPYTAKQLHYFDIAKNTLLQNNKIIYPMEDLCDTIPYHNQPNYKDDKENTTSSYWDCVSKWNKESQLTHKMDTFPNGTLVVTYPWGGIKVYNNKDICYFAVDKSIASVCCYSDNKNIILGSYDGSVTIVDITQKNDKQYTTKNYFKEHYKYQKISHPLTIPICQLQDKEPITHIVSLDDELFFSTKNHLFKAQISKTTESINYEKLSDSNNLITAITLVDKNPVFATDNGDITILYDNNTQKLSPYKDSPCINCMFSYTDSKQKTFLLTGTNHGVLEMWAISRDYKTIKLSSQMYIKHEHPIYSIEVSPDKERILVKTTESVKKTNNSHEKYVDHVYLYSTPENFPKHIENYYKKISKIETLYNNHQNNAQVLYKLFVQHIAFLNSKHTIKGSSIKETIKTTILQLLANKVTIVTLHDLTATLLLFDGVRIGQSSVYCTPDKMEKNPPDDIINAIINKQKEIFADRTKYFYTNKTLTKEQLNTFAKHFEVEINWKKLLDKNTQEIASCIEPTNPTFYL